MTPFTVFYCDAARAGQWLDDARLLALAISITYGFQLRSDDKENRRVFASLRALSQHIEQQRTA